MVQLIEWRHALLLCIFNVLWAAKSNGGIMQAEFYNRQRLIAFRLAISYCIPTSTASHQVDTQSIPPKDGHHYFPPLTI